MSAHVGQSDWTSALSTKRRRVLVGTAVFAVSLVGVMTFGQAPAIGASTCQATDTTAGTAPQSSLQMVLDAAQNGDRIEVQGYCIGTFVVTKSVFLIGEPSQAEPNPTLDGSLSGTVLTVQGAKGAQVNVTIRDLTIRNGQGSLNGGGIHSVRADLVLAGSTAIVSNKAQYGGGVFFTLGRLILADSATIGDNELYGVGGWAAASTSEKGFCLPAAARRSRVTALSPVVAWRPTRRRCDFTTRQR